MNEHELREKINKTKRKLKLLEICLLKRCDHNMSVVEIRPHARQQLKRCIKCGFEDIVFCEVSNA